MKNALETAISFILIGILCGIGIRMAEHIIPAPELRVMVCAVGQDDTLQVCKPLSELIGHN